MELRPDVSLVVVVDDNEKLLVIKRSKQSTDTGRWESPVGHRDSGETAEEAALREVKEETGLKVTLFPESFQKTNPDGKKIQVFMARAKTTEVKLEPKEHDEFKWLTLKEIEDLTPTHPAYKKDVAKIIKLNSDKQKEKKAMLGRGYIPPQLRNNNYVATYPLGASMPKKPNPAAQVKPVQPVKADAAGIQQAMAKRGSEQKPKMKDKDFSTGADALDSLKEHMRKKGFDEFQTNFFSHLITKGLNESQIKVAIAKVESLDKEAAESLKSGFEKLSFAAAFKGITKNIPGQIRNWWGAKPSQIGPAVTSFGQNLMKNPGNALKPIAGRAATGAVSGVLNPTAPNVSDQPDMLTYARKALPHALGGAALGAVGGKTTNQALTRANTGAGVGQTLGFIGDTALGTDNLRPALSNAGFLTAGLAGRKLQPSQINKLDPMHWLAQGGKVLKNNPLLAGGAMIGGGAALGGTAIGNGLADANPVSEKNKATTQQMINDAISSNQGINDTLNIVKDTANSWNAQNILGNAGNQLNEGAGGLLGSLGLGGLGDTLKNNPWLLPMLLTGLAGGAGGYALGGRGGAALGGIGLPLIMYLLSQQNKGGANVAPPLNSPPASAAAQAKPIPALGNQLGQPNYPDQPDLGGMANNLSKN